jgi:hypothetical protein
MVPNPVRPRRRHEDHLPAAQGAPAMSKSWPGHGRPGSQFFSLLGWTRTEHLRRECHAVRTAVRRTGLAQPMGHCTPHGRSAPSTNGMAGTTSEPRLFWRQSHAALMVVPRDHGAGRGTRAGVHQPLGQDAQSSAGDGRITERPAPRPPSIPHPAHGSLPIAAQRTTHPPLWPRQGRGLVLSPKPRRPKPVPATDIHT